ncbi:hypothetical protein QQ020_02125 [Fulvivirgaceae bacterium BMA12]|uniref:Fibronectin type-III domain-containing protein n=1 Tax=Agaribacillus aureus TaxID=3051825 RepID=A0ABT8KZD7_9BACT|nr:hypothetical protein [Fulvivirgaceae bacterium BMA12]
MKILNNLLVLVLIAVILGACKNDDEPAPVNEKPTAVNVSVEAFKNEAALSWTPSYDPEGTPLTYDIELGGNIVEDSYGNLSYTFTDLKYETAYSGRIIARDGDGNATATEFSFTTDFLFLQSYEQFGGEFFLQYDDRNRLSIIHEHVVAFDEGGNLSAIGPDRFLRNSSGLITRIETGSNLGTIEYDGFGKIIETSTNFQYPSGTAVARRNHKYDEDGRLIQVVESYSFAALRGFKRKTISYNGENISEVVTEHSTDGINFSPDRRVVYTYDTQKNPWYTLLEEQLGLDELYLFSDNYFFHSIDLGYIEPYATLWMSKNNLLSSTWYDNTGAQEASYVYTYHYNEYGYPIDYTMEVVYAHRGTGTDTMRFNY